MAPINPWIVDGQAGNFIIDECGWCGSEFYNVVVDCPVCGNKMLTSTKVSEEVYEIKKRELFKKRVKEILREKEQKDD